MENRLYPTWEQLAEQNNPLTEGERALIAFLDEHLPKDPAWQKGQRLVDYNGWLIFAQPFLNGSRPDVIIFHPRVGVVIYEVKDWNLELYTYDKVHRQAFVKTAAGPQPVASPIEQVRHYRNKLIGQLVPAIGEAMERDTKNGALVRTGLYFHAATTKKCQHVFGDPNKRLDYFPLFGHDGLEAEHIKVIVPDVERRDSYYWQSEWNEEVLFWLLPPFHSIEQGTILRVKGNQDKVAEPKPGHHRVRGVAGSGKTQALAYRAAKLASQGHNVLVLTFNITLWHYIRDMIARAPFNFSWKRIEFNHFHGFCKDQLFEAGFHWPLMPDLVDLSYADRRVERENFFRATVPQSVTNAVEGRSVHRYDAVLIDEGQDYHYEWYALMNEHFLGSRDELVIVCDKRQNIFERELDWLDKRVTRKGLEKFRDPYIDLEVTYRLPKQVALLTNEFSVLFGLNQELKVGRIEDNPVLLHSQHIVWLNIKEEEWMDHVVNAFKRLKREGYSVSDMVFLLPDHVIGMVAVGMFKDMGIDVNHVFEDKSKPIPSHRKRAFWMGDGRLKMSTIHSFKGWELLNIVLYIPPYPPDTDENMDAVVYTALTRTRENLIVLNANERYTAFGDKLPKHWNEQ